MQTDVTALLRRIHRLELVARRNAGGILAGDYRTAIRGQGMVFHETRKYVEGDPVRLIDWNTTARLGEPYVKVHLEERQREVVVALDVSPSMHAGLQEKTKLEYAVELAATLAASAVEGGDRLGWVVFADEVLAQHRPRGGRRQLFRALRSFLEHTGPWRRTVEVSDPRAAIHALERWRRGRFVVFLISDFIDYDVPEDLKYLKARHDVSLLHVYDPLEYAATGKIVFRGYSPEGRRGSASLSPGDTGTRDEIERFLRDKCGEYRIAFDSFSTALPVRSGLNRFFHKKRRQLV
jgi:uncharacterized protein (DUF58 family)